MPAATARLAITKRVNKRIVRPLQPVKFIIDVKNTSSATATNVVVCDVPPVGFVYKKLSAGLQLRSGNACKTFAKLTPGQRVQVTAIGLFVRQAPGLRPSSARTNASNASIVAATARVRLLRLAAGRTPGITG